MRAYSGSSVSPTCHSLGDPQASQSSSLGNKVRCDYVNTLRLFLIIWWLFLSFGTTDPALGQNASRAKAAASFANLPLRFEPNVGQTQSPVQFVSRGRGYKIFFTSNETVFVLNPPNPQQSPPRFPRARFIQKGSTPPASSTVIRMKLVGANLSPQLSSADQLPGEVNYFIGRDPQKWHAGIPTYSKIRYAGIYPNIDLVYYGNQHQLESDFVINPGGDSSQIALSFDGPDSISVDPSGNLVLATKAGQLVMRKPVIYQMQNGNRISVVGGFEARRGNTIGLNVKDYDHSKPLVIDPVLSYATYLGGSGEDFAYAIAVDSQGDAYITGGTDSSDFPVVGTSLSSAPNGTFTAFVTKLNANGTDLVYATYLGGTGGDFGLGIAVDGTGAAYVSGETSSTDFPVTTSAYQPALASGAVSNAFVSKLSADGQSLLYSTYLGGGGTDLAERIAVDANQNAYITGRTTSGTPSPFPTTSNAFQPTIKSMNGNAFVSRIDTTKAGASSLVYSTFLGGTAPTGSWECGNGIAIDANQNVYVTGLASSSDFPITPTAYQSINHNGFSAFLTRLDTSQSGSAGLIYSTFLGGSNESSGEQGSGVALDPNGGVYITGGTGSGDFPTTTGVSNSAEGKAFVAKFDTTQSQSASLVYSTLVGGSAGEYSFNIKVDPNGDAYIDGWTWSSDFPVTVDAFQSAFGTPQDIFLAVLSPDGLNIIYGSYLGSGSEGDESAEDIALDANNNIYVAGGVDSSTFEASAGAVQRSLDGTSDAFVMKLTEISTSPNIASLSPTLGAVGTPVAITGANFGSTQDGSTVTFNGVAATPTSWSATSLATTVPTGATTGDVLVTVGGVSSNGVNFTVASTCGETGQSGTDTNNSDWGFASPCVTGSNANGYTLASIQYWVGSPTSASFDLGIYADSTGVPGSLLCHTGTTTLIPSAGWNNISLSGKGCPTLSANTRYWIGYVTGSNTIQQGIVNGNCPGTSLVSVYTNSVQESAVLSNPFGATAGTPSCYSMYFLLTAVLNMPTITSLSTTSGPVGTGVTITGTNFGATQGTSTVTFNGTIATVTSWSATSLVTTVPTGATSGNVVVTVGGVASNGVSFTVGSGGGTLNISSLSPTSGVVGTSVTIMGTGFGATQGSDTVTFNGTTAIPSDWTSASIVVLVPTGATTGSVIVTVGGAASNGAAFSVTPTIASLNGTSGPVGTQVTILGTGFGASQGASTVTFNGIAASPTTWSATSIAVPVPVGATTGNVVVTVGGVASNGEMFTVTASESIVSYYYIEDSLGTSRVITDSAGNLCYDADFYPFGGERAYTDTCPQNYKFTGKERDSESGLDNFGARYNSSQFGRFMSPDPLGGSLIDPQTLNKYSYVRNNPINLTDPTGMYECSDDQNKCKTKQDLAFEAARQNDLKSKDPDVVRAASAYGDPTKDNGVNVGFADLSKKNEGGDTTSTLGTDANQKLRANSNVVIDSNTVNAGGSALDAVVGHEGSHVADAQDLVNSITITDLTKGTFTVGQDITQYASEQRAYHVTDSILRSDNTHETFQCGVATCQLGNTILRGQVTNIVDQILRSNYRSDINNQPLTERNPGASVVPH